MTRVNIEIDDEVHRKLKVVCALKGITIIQYINSALEEKVKKEKI
jgi:predicted HicB family RNase H-like nuclease